MKFVYILQLDWRVEYYVTDVSVYQYEPPTGPESTDAQHLNSIKLYSTSYLPRSSSLVQPLHVPLLTDIQRSVYKHLKERQPCSLVDLPGIEAILIDKRTHMIQPELVSIARG